MDLVFPQASPYPRRILGCIGHLYWQKEGQDWQVLLIEDEKHHKILHNANSAFIGI